MSARSTLRSRVRQDALDKESVNWEDSEIDDSLNRSASYVAMELSRHDILEQMLGTETFTDTAGTKSYALSATDILHFRELYWVNPDTTSKDVKCNRMDRRQRGDYYRKTWDFYPERSTSTGLWSIKFSDDPGGGNTFRVEYVKKPAEITTGSGSDSTEYTTIPEEFEDLIVARAVWILTGPDGSQKEHAAANFKMLLDQAKAVIQSDALPDEDFVRKY